MRLGEVPYAAGEFALLVQRGEAALIATPNLRLAPGDRLWCARPASAPSPLAAVLEHASEVGV
jgi:hypothetical protein